VFKSKCGSTLKNPGYNPVRELCTCCGCYVDKYGVVFGSEQNMCNVLRGPAVGTPGLAGRRLRIGSEPLILRIRGELTPFA